MDAWLLFGLRLRQCSGSGVGRPDGTIRVHPSPDGAGAACYNSAAGRSLYPAFCAMVGLAAGCGRTLIEASASEPGRIAALAWRAIGIRARRYGGRFRTRCHHNRAARRSQHFRGKGNLVGVGLSLLVILNLRNGMGLADITGNTQNYVIGGLLILSVLIPNLYQELKNKWKGRER